MTKDEAVAYMIKKVEEIEQERLAAHFSIDPSKQKKEAVDGIIKVNCTPLVRQYDTLSNKWGVLLCQKEYRTNDIHQSLSNWW